MAWYDLEKGAKVPQPQGQEVADWYRGTDADLSMSETLHVMANIKAQRDSLLAALETISGSAWVLPVPELNRITINAIKAEADRAIASVKQEGEGQ